jgi:vancomycin resistance protein YoaR
VRTGFKFYQKMTAKFIGKFILFFWGLCLIQIFVFTNSAQSFASKEANRINLANKDNINNFIEKTFYLFGIDKEDAIPFYLKNFVEWDHTMTYDLNYKTEIENIFLNEKSNPFDNYWLDITQIYSDKIHYKKSSSAYLKKKEIESFLESIAEKINQEPQNAKFNLNTESKKLTVLEKSRLGSVLNVSESFEKIKLSLNDSPETSYIPLSVSVTEPEISSDDPNKYQIKELIGAGKSDFTGSSSTRIHNIKTAAKKFNGLVLKPEEEFSFTTILGEVDETTGYKEELVIKKNQTVPEYGGGICQVSTTMFRAALNSGTKITERHNHSYPVHYYNPPGTDATVYVPQPDLKFKNNTNEYLLIQTEINEEERKFYINFYSKEDLFDVEVIGPEVIERTPEGRLRTTLKQIVIDKETEKEVFQDVFNSFYDNPDNYPNPNDIVLEKPKDWSKKQWEEYYAKFGAIIEEMKKEN